MLCEKCGKFHFREQKHECKKVFICGEIDNATDEDKQLIQGFINRAEERDKVGEQI